MAVFKCKMCGGTLEIKNNETVAVCEYCGTKQTLPKLDDDRKANLYDRANHFRRNNEFDKAMGIYEQILNEDSTDAESYWSLVLCRYGIEYVEDPATHKRIATVNRAQYTSIFDDEDYKSALQYADGSQKEVYEAEANVINEIQKGILAISGKEEPFDVFICYKETDQNGRRTPDSVLATELYHELTREGFKVFFSRITLEDKLGQEYEPYIFAALNSAKVMVVLGTKPEYFNAVWVKNEWNRYLALIKNGARKVLIPAFKDMDPYDLPEEFSHLQAQDMAKLGFMQDLIRGIKKLTQADENKEPVKETVVVNTNTNIAPLLKRAFMFLEDGDFARADEFCEQVLNQDPENAAAYLGKLMAELKVRKQEDLADCEQPFDESNNYKKAIRFADKKLSKTLNGYISHINERNENARLEGIYSQSVRAMNGAITQTDYEQAAQAFEAIESYKNSSGLAKECRENADICRKNDIYNTAKMLINGTNESAFTAAIEKFEEIPGWKDSDELIMSCHSKIEEIKAKEEADRLEAERKAEEMRIADEKAAQRHKRVLVLSIAFLSFLIAFLIVLTTVIIPSIRYNRANSLAEKGQFQDAYLLFAKLDDYKDSTELTKSNKYKEALRLLEANELEKSKKLFYQLGDYENASLYFKSILSLPTKRTYDEYTWTFKYDSNGNVIEERENSKGRCFAQHKWQYNNEGKVLKEYSDDELLYTYEYDNDGKLTKLYYSDDYWGNRVTEYFYNLEGNITTEFEYEIDEETGKKQDKTYRVKSYEYADGLCINEEENYTNSRQSETINYSYDSSGYLTECVKLFTYDDTTKYIYKFKYDKSGNVLEQTCETVYDSGLSSTDIDIFKYDDIGNCIAKNDVVYSEFNYYYNGLLERDDLIQDLIKELL